MAPMHRVAAGLLGVTAIALIGMGGVHFLEFLGAGDDSWQRLAIVPAVVAIVSGILVGGAAVLVLRDTVAGWIVAALVSVVLGIAWIDLGAGTTGGEALFLGLPLLVIGALLALTVVRLTRSASSEGR